MLTNGCQVPKRIFRESNPSRLRRSQSRDICNAIVFGGVLLVSGLTLSHFADPWAANR